MVELNLLEKIKLTFDLIFSSSLFFILFIGILCVIVDVLYISRKSRTVKIIYVFLSLLLILGLSINYLKDLLLIVHEVNKQIVEFIYFPTITEYVMIMFVMLIVMIISLFSKKTYKVIKGINIGVFIANLYIFFLIIDQISKSEIDLSNKIDVYKHQNLMVLFQLSLFIFIVWACLLVITRICRILINKPENVRVDVVKDEAQEEIELPKRKEEIINFYEEPELPVKLEDLKHDNKYIVDLENLQNKVIEGVFTLEEYKDMKKLLQNIKKVG